MHAHLSQIVNRHPICQLGRPARGHLAGDPTGQQRRKRAQRDPDIQRGGQQAGDRSDPPKRSTMFVKQRADHPLTQPANVVMVQHRGKSHAIWRGAHRPGQLDQLGLNG